MNGSFLKRFGEKVESCEKDLLAIVQIQARPPHYVVQVTFNILQIHVLITWFMLIVELGPSSSLERSVVKTFGLGIYI